jgi:hypothetical protein
MAWEFLGTNTLYWQPDTRISTFKPGLVLVQRSAVCRNDYLTTARSQIGIDKVLPCDSPSTVTVFQFPAAQEIHESNGFVRFDVSGYGYYESGGITLESFYDKQVVDYESGSGVVKRILLPSIYRNFITAFSSTFAPIQAVPTLLKTSASVVGGGSVTLAWPNLPEGSTPSAWRLLDGGIVGVYGKYMEVDVTYRFEIYQGGINIAAP